MPPDAEAVARHKTALVRTALSRPVSRGLEDGLITSETRVFDFGCGRGGDVERLNGLGIDCAGYDPNFFADAPLRPSDVVNLGYVVNVIEDEEERAETLRRAWDLAGSVLIVSARTNADARRLEPACGCGDGVLTGLGTFQKFFGQEELREWIGDVLGETGAIAAEPGIFYVFRDPARAELFRLTRVRRPRPRRRKSDVVFKEHQELFEDLMEFVDETGRLPRAGEFVRDSELRERVGTPAQAFQVIRNVTDEERWDRARLARYDDLLVYLALSRFHRRPKLSHLPTELQIDIKEFFGSYKAAGEQGDRALFAIGEQGRLTEAIDAAEVGKRMPSALYVHVSAVGHLPIALRVLEGAGRELLGVVPEATLVKIDRGSPRVAYLQYPTFDEDPHPALHGAYAVRLDELRTDYLDYTHRDNPPILHRKEEFVSVDYRLRDRFARLTRQEADAGLFRDPSRIGTRQEWEKLLNETGVEIHGHRLTRSHG